MQDGVAVPKSVEHDEMFMLSMLDGHVKRKRDENDDGGSNDSKRD